MAIVRWKRTEFRITGHPLTRGAFERWIEEEGRNALRTEVRNTRWRWFAGEDRAKSRLYRKARSAFRPRGTFAGAMRRKLDRFPVAIRSCAAEIQRAGHRHLCTYDAEKHLIVVPRGVVFHDFKTWLLQELASLPQVGAFQGLTEHVIITAAVQAELAFFDYVNRGNPFVDENGHGIIIQTDREFRWRADGYDGHWCYALSVDERVDLTARRERRIFMTALQEPARAQNVYLHRLRSEDLRETIDAIRLHRLTINERRVRSRRAESLITIE